MGVHPAASCLGVLPGCQCPLEALYVETFIEKPEFADNNVKELALNILAKPFTFNAL